MNTALMVKELTNNLLRVPRHLQADTPILNTFSEGLYSRAIFIPKGTLIVGKKHRRETLNICALGDITVLTELGVARFQAGDIVVSKPGIRKVGYAHVDSVWVNVHATHERDLAIIEEQFIEQDDEEFDTKAFMQKVREA